MEGISAVILTWANAQAALDDAIQGGKTLNELPVEVAAVDTAVVGLSALPDFRNDVISYTISYMSKVAETADTVISAFPSIENPTAVDEFNK